MRDLPPISRKFIRGQACDYRHLSISRNTIHKYMLGAITDVFSST